MSETEGLSADGVEISVLREMMPIEHQAAFDIIARLYGRDTESLLNGLMDMTVRTAMLGGVSPESFAAGMKHTWDGYVEAINGAVS